MLRRHGPAAAATLTLAGLIAGVVVGAVAAPRDSAALPRFVTPESKVIFVDAKAGQEVWFSWSGPFRPETQERVFVLAAELTRVHPGLEVVKLLGANKELGAGPAPRVYVGSLLEDERYPRQSLLPVPIMRFEPGRAEQAWYFLAAVKADKPGTYRLGGWRLRYRAGKLQGTTVYEQSIEIRVS